MGGELGGRRRRDTKDGGGEESVHGESVRKTERERKHRPGQVKPRTQSWPEVWMSVSLSQPLLGSRDLLSGRYASAEYRMVEGWRVER